MLDELVGVIETLKSRISEHRAVLQGNEAQTRMSLIDPLLRALGWDTSDPDLVRPEYVVGGRRADYALVNAQGDVVVFLEAKNLGEHLSNHRSQVVAYASELGIRFPALTNGNEWEVYDNSQLVPIEQRRILNVSIADTDSAKCALQFLLLWHPNLATGQPIEASEPIMGTEPANPVNATPIETTVPARPDAGWVSLKDFVATPGTTPPKIRFPSDDELQPSKWKDLLHSGESGEWDGQLAHAGLVEESEEEEQKQEPLAGFPDAGSRQKWILAQAIPALDKMILSMMETHADIRTGRVMGPPGEDGQPASPHFEIAVMMQFIPRKERQIRYALKRLKDAGYLRVESFRMRGKANRYHLTIPD